MTSSCQSTGGVIATDKSWWYSIHFDWKDGQWSYGSTYQLMIDSLKCNNKDGISQNLKFIPSDTAEEMLGVFLAPDGNNKEQVKQFKFKSKTTYLSELICTGHLERSESWIALNHVVIKSLEYDLPALTLAEEVFLSIMWSLLQGYLPKAGINRNIPHAVLYGPVEKMD